MEKENEFSGIFHNEEVKGNGLIEAYGAYSGHIHDFSCHTNYEEFENIPNLDKNQMKVILRIIKYYFERHINTEIPDGLFLELIKKYPYLAPKHPLASPYARLGYTEPINKLLSQYGYKSISYRDISSFFNCHSRGKWKYNGIILHVPHSSRSFPEGCNYSFDDLNGEERLLIDYYTDELFVPTQTSKYISSMVFPYCRLYCDVERLINDPLEEKGLGISYYSDVTTWFGEKRRSFSNIKDAFKLYVDFHAEMSKKLFENWDRKLLIDCHSFSALPNLLNSNPPDIDICIGFNDDGTCPDKVVIGNIVHYFRSLGYKVGINEPFSNSKTFEVPIKYHSVMIEVNKRLYMNENTLEKTDGFISLQHDISSLYNILLRK